jgi:hypothetical protein
MDGLLTREEVDQAMSMAAVGARAVHQLQADALRRVYERADEGRRVPLELQPGEVRSH